MLGNPLGEGVGVAALELRLLLDEGERNRFLLDDLLLDLLYVVHDLDTQIGVVLEVENVVIDLDVVVHNVDLVGKNRDLRRLGGRGRSLLRDRDDLFLDQFGVLLGEDTLFLLLGLVFEREDRDQKGQD